MFWSPLPRQNRTMVFHLEPDATSAFARMPAVEGDAESWSLLRNAEIPAGKTTKIGLIQFELIFKEFLAAVFLPFERLVASSSWHDQHPPAVFARWGRNVFRGWSRLASRGGASMLELRKTFALECPASLLKLVYTSSTAKSAMWQW